jgi:hypothetical protein
MIQIIPQEINESSHETINKMWDVLQEIKSMKSKTENSSINEVNGKLCLMI